jgi:uncharacterized protein
MTVLAAREHHRFEAAGRPFVYLVPSAAIFELDDAADAIMRTLTERPRPHDELVADLAAAHDGAVLSDTIAELLKLQALGETRPVAAAPPPRRVLPLKPIPLQTMVLNVTNQCNLSCTYCYEYGEDKIVDTENGKKPKFMSDATARESVDFMFKEAGDSKRAHLTFFGGETLLNFPVLKKTVIYAREQAAALGKEVDFSLTTNATLLKPEIVDFVVENGISVTVSIDGPAAMQDKFRVFHNGAGSYDVVAPKIKELIARHRTRPIGARVTLTSSTLDVKTIYRHLTEEIGFREVGFAPVTTSPNRDYAITGSGFDDMLGQFRELAYEFLECAVENKHHGFSNVKETVGEIHKGLSKAFPCGAGIGLLGVATDGDVALCHRFAGSDEHKFGTVRDGIDRAAQAAFMTTHHIENKTDCATCWARPVCSGGCYHEAYTRFGDTASPTLHYCDWIRGWTDVCLQIYGELALRNPAFLAQFDDEPAEKVA